MEKRNIFETEVLIIGAGLSGLTAAYELFSRGFGILVLESQDRVGGRTLTAHLKTSEPEAVRPNDSGSSQEKQNQEAFQTEKMANNEEKQERRYESDDIITKPFDLGGQWITDSQSHIIQLLRRLEIDTHAQHNNNVRLGIDLDVFDPSESTTHISNNQVGVPGLHPFRGILPKLPGLFEVVEMDSFVYKVEKLCKTAVLGEECRQSYKELEGLSIGDLIRSKISRPITKKIMLAVIETIHGADPDQISASYFLAHANAAGGFISQCRASLHGHDRRNVEGGAQNISNTLHSLVGVDRVIFNAEVTSVTEFERRVLVETSTSDRFSANCVIIAIPPKELLSIVFSPPLSNDRLLVLHNLLPSKSCKFVVTYKEAFWKELGFSGDVITYGTGHEGYQKFYDRTPGHQQLAVTFYIFDSSSETHGAALTGVLSSDICDYWSRKEVPERKSAILNGLCQIFGPQALYPIDYAEKVWSGEPFGESCSTYLPAIGSMENYSMLSEGHGRRIFFAGSETATSWPGYMNGAVQAGERAACEVLYYLSPNALSALEIHEYVLNRRASVAIRKREVNEEGRHLIIATSETNAERNIDDEDIRLPMPFRFISENYKLIFVAACLIFILCKRYKK